ncbi:MAG: hypothetical protein V4858_10260 [Pseudomonadota bacterium]
MRKLAHKHSNFQPPAFVTLPRPSNRWIHSLALCTSLAVCLFSQAACGGGGSGSGQGNDTTPVTPPPAAAADISVLMMGNSHSSVSDLPQRLEAMLRAARPGKTVAVVVAPDWLFLEQHLVNTRTLGLLQGQTWSAVVLQAQKYSTSGLFNYSTREAEALVRMARVAKATPVMFPEWPLRGVPETERIYNLHVSIAKKEPACVAPIGQAWDLALQRDPTLVLYDVDGNHAAAAGAHLTALVLFTTLTGLSPSQVPSFAQSNVPANVQAQLKTVATDAASATAPRVYCPTDKVL